MVSASGPVDGPKYGERAPHSPITESLLILATLKLKQSRRQGVFPPSPFASVLRTLLAVPSEH